MDSSNAIVEDNLDDGSNFTQIGMDMGQINEKMQKMETELVTMKNAMNQAEPSMMTWQMGVKFGKMEKEMEDLRGQINKISNENGQLKKENETMKNHIVGGTNGQQMLKFDSIELKKNKMDLADRARKLSFAEDELLVTSYDNGWRCVRAVLPVPVFDRNTKKSYIAFYFEGNIKKSSNRWWGDVGMGFCSLQFPLEDNYIGQEQNSIGINRKLGMHNCGKLESLGFKQEKGPFKAGDKIGLGLIYEPKNASAKCFAIYNRKLLGSAKLPAKFFDVPIYPVVGLCDSGNSIQLNFGNEEWDFDPRQCQLIQ